jgi:5-(hydroxymethyl)furfural/furfural oxidase
MCHFNSSQNFSAGSRTVLSLPCKRCDAAAMEILQKPFDVIIVGGGSAGCVLAARLSETAHREVLLIEAGQDLTAHTLPSQVAAAYPGIAYFDPSLTNTNLMVRMGNTGSNAPGTRKAVPYSQGRVLGGGSAINGIGANRGAPADYDEWEAEGATGWNWNNVLPFFRKLERHLEEEGPLHGKDGPLPIRAVPDNWRSHFVNATLRALEQRGVRQHRDQNGVWQDGVFPQAVNLDETLQRVPTSVAWLTDDVRKRKNLTIITGVCVHHLTFSQQRATGVVLDLGSAKVPVTAHETILAAGALQTPALMMRSGIGPAAHLKERGIGLVNHLAGVGQNLMEHPYAGVALYLPRQSRMHNPKAHHIPAIWRFSSGLDGCPSGDIHMGIMGRSAWHAVGMRMGALAFWVNKSYSRGHVTLDQDSERPPLIDMRLLSDERDRIRLRNAFRDIAGLARDIASGGAAGYPQPARLSDRARKYGPVTLRNRLATGLAGLLVDCAGPFGASVMRALTHEGPTLDDLLQDESALDAYLDHSVTGVWHASGTCRMGQSTNPLAVTDPSGRVYGVEGLRICDASVFPTIPCANLNVPVIMTAERIASLIKAER